MLVAAWATLIAYLVWTASIAWVSLRLYPIHYSARMIFSVLVAFTAAFGGMLLADHLNLSSLPLVTLVKLGWVVLIFSAAGYLLWRQRHAWLAPTSQETSITGNSAL